MTSKNVTVIVHNVRSAFNVGSIFRTADAAGVERVSLCGYTPLPAPRGKKRGNTKIAKTALGAEKSVAWEHHAQIGPLLKRLKTEGRRLVALEQSRKSKSIFKFNSRAPVALIVGNEVAGLNRKILARCDDVVQIPMHGQKESLNVAVAFGIAVYALTTR